MAIAMGFSVHKQSRKMEMSDDNIWRYSRAKWGRHRVPVTLPTAGVYKR